MLVERKIGNISLEVDINEASDLYFDEDIAAELEPGIGGIIKTIHQNSERSHLPLSVFIELTNKCNFSCPFCYINEPNIQFCRIPDFSEFKNTLDFLIQQGMIYCILSGGECLTHPDFAKIYLYLKKNGVLVTIFTNGYLLNDHLLSLFTEYKPFKIEISIYGSDDTSYRCAVNQESIKSQTVFANILQLQQNNINIIAKTPITSLTEQSYPAIEAWCEEHHIPYYTGTELMSSYSGVDKNEYLASETLRNLMRNKSDAEFYADSTMINLANQPLKQKMNFDCSAGRTEVFITAEYKLLPCMKATDIAEWQFSIMEFGIASAYSQLMQKIHQHINQPIRYCDGCEHHEVCQKCFFTQFDPDDSYTKRKRYCAELKRFCTQTVL